MSASVFGPAREIVTLARKIMTNVDEQRSLSERREGKLHFEPDQECADKQIELDEENDAASKKIELLFLNVAQAIRLRVTP